MEWSGCTRGTLGQNPEPVLNRPRVSLCGRESCTRVAHTVSATPRNHGFLFGWAGGASQFLTATFHWRSEALFPSRQRLCGAPFLTTFKADGHEHEQTHNVHDFHDVHKHERCHTHTHTHPTALRQRVRLRTARITRA